MAISKRSENAIGTQGCGEEMDKLRSKWEILLRCRPSIKGMVGNGRLISGHIGHNSNDEKMFHFITTKGTFSYDECKDEFESKLQIR